MQLLKYLMLSPLVLVLASCTAPEPITVVKTEVVKQNIPVVARPRPVSLIPPTFYVVNRDNFEQFITDFNKKNITNTFIAMSVKDYENLSLSIADLRRYLDQQNEIIVYYEKQLKE